MLQIIDKKDCCGCHACANVCPKHCIDMKADEQGFLYPNVDTEKCIDCGLCEKVCPVINQSNPSKPIKVYAAKNTDEEIRKQSSSGGIFTLLAEKIINAGGVVFGAKFDAEWNVVHSWTDTIEGISDFRGSKYVQSTIGNTYSQTKAFLEQGRYVLFSGTPCQIAGLKKYLRKEYDKLITVDLVCHGVPSPLIWQKYLKEEFKQNRTLCGDGKNSDSSSLNENPVLSGISFRDKTNGWKKYGFRVSMAASKAAKNTVSESAKDNYFLEPLTTNLYMQIFLRDLSLRPSCFNCPSKSFKSKSDLTLADFWGIEYIDEEFMDDKGCSLLILNTVKANNMIEEIIQLYKKEYEPNIAFKYNPAIFHSVKKKAGRKRFWKQVYRNFPLRSCLLSANPTLIERCINKIKSLVSI